MRSEPALAQIRFYALDGAHLSVDGPDVLAWPVAVSCVAIEGWLGRLVLAAGPVGSAFVRHSLIEGMSATEEYDHHDGTVSVSAGGLYDPEDFRYYGEQYGAIWHKGPVAIAGMTEEHEKRWLLDYFGLLQPVSNDRSICLEPTAEWQFVRLPEPAPRLMVTIPGVGPLEYVDPGRSASLRRSSSRSIGSRIGELHCFDGQRVEDRVLLTNKSGAFMVNALESNARTARDALAELQMLEWRE